MLELSEKIILKKKIFELMTPQSLNYLCTKKLPFNFEKGNFPIFSWTIYSNSAKKKYSKFLQKHKKIEENRENFSIFYKYMRCLTSKINLIEMKAENSLDFHEFYENYFKTNLNNNFLKNYSKNPSEKLLLIQTRKAKHIQKFDYTKSLIYDKKIQKFES